MRAQKYVRSWKPKEMKLIYGNVTETSISEKHIINAQMMLIWPVNNNNMRCRAKKLQKQLDKSQLQLTESRAQIRDLKLQLSDAGDCKVSNYRLTPVFVFLNYILFKIYACTVDFVGKSEENRWPREASSRIRDVANAFLTKSHSAQRTSTIAKKKNVFTSYLYINMEMWNVWFARKFIKIVESGFL